MKIDIKNLPSDANLLQEIIADLSLEVTRLLTENEKLKHQLALLKAKRFGKSSEKLERQIEELELRIEENEQAAKDLPLIYLEDEDTKEAVQAEEAGTLSFKEKAKRKKLPEHLERIPVTLNPEPKCPSCGSESFRKISDDISEVLEYVPSSFKVIRYIRPRCACTKCEEIVQAYPAAKPIEKGNAGAGLLSHILVQKYCNHLPFYRQSEIYEREGVELSRSTMAGWAGKSARLLEPLIEELRKSVFSASEIHGDDTPVKVLAPGSGKTKTGRIWSYVRDGRGYGSEVPAAICYYYSPDRKGARPALHLEGFEGVLHADAYAGYNGLYVSENNPEAKIEEAACWAHTRRKFYEVTIGSNNARVASETLERIQNIYKIEDEIRGKPRDERKGVRQERIKKLVEELFRDFRKYQKELPKKSETARAIFYALKNEDALKRFLENGKIEIDNNIAERSMRSIALGRKNWLFAGSDSGGETAAAIYSLTETAKINGLNPWAYLKYVFSVIQDYNSQKISDLLPWNVKPEFLT